MLGFRSIVSHKQSYRKRSRCSLCLDADREPHRLIESESVDLLHGVFHLKRDLSER